MLFIAYAQIMSLHVGRDYRTCLWWPYGILFSWINCLSYFFFLTFISDTEVIWLICSCSGLEKNVQSFSPVVIPFADSLKHCSDVAVKRSIACALERLSNDPYNCFLIHQHDALKVNCFINDTISILQCGRVEDFISFGSCLKVCSS